MPNLQSVSFTSPGYDYAADQAEILRRQQLAQALQEQSMQPLATNRMVGRTAIPISPLEGAAQIAQGAASEYENKRAIELARKLREKQMSDTQGDMSAMVNALRGSPGSQQPPDALGGGPAMPPQAPGRLDPSIIGNLKTPQMQQVAMQLFLQQMQPKPPLKAGPGDQFLDPTTFKPLGGVAPLQKYHNVGGNLVPEPQPGAPVGAPIQPVYTAPQKPDELTQALTAAGIDIKSPEAQALFRSRAMKIATHQPATNVVTNVSTEKKYGEQFAGQIAKADSDMRDAAIKAPQLAERANQIKKLLSTGKAITGTAAEFRLQFAKAAQLAGLGSGSASDTEQLSVSMAQNTLDAIKASGLGSGSGFSNADRDFLEKAVGGKISLEKETISRLADLAYKASVKTAEKWNTRVKQIPRTALEGTGITQDPVPMPPLFGTPEQMPADDPLGIRRK